MTTRRLTGVILVLLMLTVAQGCGSGSSSRVGAATFSKSYGGSGFDEARAAIPTSDGGYVFVGGIGGVDNAISGDSTDLWISKLDANGNVEWQSAIGAGSLGARTAFSIARSTPDGGVVVAGYSYGGPATGNDAWIAKLSGAGIIEWQSTVDSGGWPAFDYAGAQYGRGAYADDWARDIGLTPDGGYVVAGESKGNITERGSGTIYVDASSTIVLKLNAQGALTWQRRLTEGQLASRSNAFELLPIIRATADNGAVLGYSSDSGDGVRLRVIRFESDGDTAWQRDDEAYLVTGLLQTHDDPDGDGDGIANDGFIVTAASVAFGSRVNPHVNQESLVLKLAADGAVEWRRVLGSGTPSVGLTALAQVCEPAAAGFACDFVVGGSRDEGRFEPLVAYVARLNSSGSTIVERSFEQPTSDFDPVRQATYVDALRGVNGGSAIAVIAGARANAHRLVLDKATLATQAVAQTAFARGNGASDLAIDEGPGRFIPGAQFSSDTAILTTNAELQRISLLVSPTPLSDQLSLQNEMRASDLRWATDVATGVVEVAPGSYIVAGRSNGLDENGDFIDAGVGWVLRITNGRVDWQRSLRRDRGTGIGRLSDGSVQAIAPSGDGGVVIAGRFGDDRQLLKLNADGGIAWESLALLAPHDSHGLQLREVQHVASGGFVVVGTIWGSNSVVYRLGADGTVTRQRAYEPIPGHSIAPTDDDGDGARDDGFVIAGADEVLDILGNPLALDIRVLKLDMAGEVVWARNYRISGAIFDPDAKIRQMLDGGYVIGLTDIAALSPGGLGQPFGQSNALLIKIGRQGEVVWSRSYGAFLDERLHDLEVLPDGGLIVAGASRSLGEGSEAWIARLGPDGLIAAGCNAHLGSLPASAFRVDVFPFVSADSPDVPRVPTAPLLVEVTGLAPYIAPLVQARQCLGSANPAEPALPPQSPQRFTLTVAQPGSDTGVVTSTPAGLACGTAQSPPPCSASFEVSDVFLSVDPGSVSRFLRWEDCSEVLPPDSGGAARCRVRMDRDRTVRAIFGAPQDRFLLRMSVIGTGTVTSSDDGIRCGTFFGANQDCEQLYDRLVAGTNQPTSITLSVFTNVSDFVGWGGDCASFGTTNAFNLVMDSDKSCTATFVGAPTSFELAVTKSGNGSGVVTSAPSGISCGTSCNASFDVGQTVRLLAFEDAGSAFDGWSGCDRIVPPPSGSIPECEVDMNANRNVGAAFTRGQVGQVLLEFAVTGSDGIVETADRGITCTSAGPDCQELYTPGTSVQLSFNLLRAGGAFLGWGGDCPFGLLPTPTLVMTADRRCTAMFSSPPTSRLTVGRVGPPSALVRSTPVGIDCGLTCSADFTNGQTVRLALELAAGSRFSGWTGCDRRPAGANPWPDCEVDMNTDRAVEVRAE